VSRDIREIECDITHAEWWAAKWRKLEEEVASAMGDLEARRQMLFISEDYRLLAESAEERRERLVAYAAAVKRGPCSQGPMISATAASASRRQQVTVAAYCEL
jgi:hypothetical protein